MQIKTTEASSFAPTALRLSNVTVGNEQVKVGVSTESGPGGGIRLNLSQAGSVQSGQASKNQDIDDSDLPDNIKNTLKMIRQLRAELAARQAELDAILARPPSSDSQREANAVSTEIASLQGAISSANASLVSQMRKQDLSSEQLLSVATFIAG
ncbi:hypothetical protein [Pseudomonas segetis]|uniref:Uncharacterized protein n=1 Tax=Pseudomonas segetis TaxID=298908 RepID=A0A239IYZ0_9PSED|nr:hypothetical protein [Pseudomonas segetis]SNS98996.1 hypothetical protein SAMN05216255_4107 [Pseudomonas segetis]